LFFECENIQTYFLSQVANINIYSRAHYRSFEYIKTINLCYVKDRKLKLLHSERHISSSRPFTFRITCVTHFELRKSSQEDSPLMAEHNKEKLR